MKKLSYLLALFIIGMQACNNPQNKDSVSMAEDANTENDSVGYLDSPTVGIGGLDSLNGSNTDLDFAIKAADGGMLEVQLGKLAATHASDQGVKDFGQRMVDDHSKVNNELMTLAKQKNIVLPPTPSQKNVDLIADLNGRKGSEFDKSYIDHMVSDHEEDIELFENASKNATDEDIKAFANKTLPTLRTHLAAAKTLKDKL